MLVAKTIKDLDNCNKMPDLHLLLSSLVQSYFFQIYKFHINMLKQVVINCPVKWDHTELRDGDILVKAHAASQACLQCQLFLSQALK